MTTNSAIEWTNHTWNPWVGCAKVSPGCKFCYMYREQSRYGNDPKTVRRTSAATFRKPLSWRDPALVFTCSWSDFFIAEADDWRGETWDMIRATPWLTYQILTKRPENIAGRLPEDWGDGWANVWLGVSVESAAYIGRLDKLARIPAAVRFVSYEPALNHVDFTCWLAGNAIDWLIVGGESGKEARPFNLGWASDVISQCERFCVPVFVKQLGDNATLDGKPYRAGRKGKDMAKWPAELRVRQWPNCFEAGR